MTLHLEFPRLHYKGLIDVEEPPSSYGCLELAI